MEQFSLFWSQVDLDRKEIHLDLTKNGDSRTVPLNSAAMDALQSSTKRKKSELVLRRKYDGTGAVQRWFNLACLALGIEDYIWHNTRHTFCSWHAMAGTPLRTIQELAGHKTISITARYAHLAPNHTAAAAERIVPATTLRPGPVSLPTAIKTATTKKKA